METRGQLTAIALSSDRLFISLHKTTHYKVNWNNHRIWLYKKLLHKENYIYIYIDRADVNMFAKMYTV